MLICEAHARDATAEAYAGTYAAQGSERATTEPGTAPLASQWARWATEVPGGVADRPTQMSRVHQPEKHERP